MTDKIRGSRLKSRFRRLQLAILAVVLLTSCSIPLVNRPSDSPTARPSAHPTAKPTTRPTSTPLPPSPEETAVTFLNAWEERDYATMYGLLSPESQSAIDAESFGQRYRSALNTATVLTVTARLRSVLREGDQARASYTLSLDTALVGRLITDTVMSLSLQDRRWGVDWDAGLIWPQLTGGNYFRMEYAIPARANIYDRSGLGLAVESKIVTVGVIPGQIEDEEALLEALTSITDLSAEEIRSQYAAAQPDWKVPIADIPAEVSVENNDLLSTISGIYRQEKEGRTYPNDGAAPHVVGWVAPVPAERLGAYRARGYRGDEKVGASGLEAWGEEILAGRHGGTLTVVTSAGEKIAEVARRPPKPSRAIHTTLDRGFQRKAQQILGDRKGAIVALDVHTGAALALVSGPGFDPNIFTGPAAALGRSQILADPRRPLINRATQGTYPAGSIFKIVTMAAGMEEAGMTPLQTTFYCPGYWDGLGKAARKYCWKEEGHGDINLEDGLSASCNVAFYTVGKALHELDPAALPRFGQGFGFGEPAGLKSLPEEGGLMPGPAWKESTYGEPWWPGDTVNLAIGQGYLRVTPLQIARMMAAIANGGTLYRPYVIQRIQGGPNMPEQITQPESSGTLPVTSQHLAVIQEALLGVTTKSIGTAAHRFIGLSVPVAGKTGTAEVGGPDTRPHSWFGAYAPAGNPEIALVVMVENSGEGSGVAAPLARQVIEAYYGLPLSPLPPEAEEGYVPPTPTPQP